MDTQTTSIPKISVFPYSNKSYVDKQKGNYAHLCTQDLIAFPNVLDKKLITEITENRHYSEAIQDNNKYHSMLKNKFGKDSDFVNLNDINKSGIGIVRLLYRSLYQRLNKVQNDYRIEAIDEKSMAEKADFLYDLKLRAKLAPVVQQATGMSIKKPMMPEEEDEIELYSSIGFKNDIEIFVEEHLKKVDLDNQYDNEIVPQINSDLINGAICGTHMYYDDDGTIIEEAIDIVEQNLKIVGGTKRDYSDMKGCSFDKEYNTEELFEYYLDDPSRYYIAGNRQYTQEEVIKLLQNNETSKGITKVKVLYWQAWDTHSKKVIKLDDGTVKTRNNNSKTGDTTTRTQMWYKSYYIETIGLSFNFGALTNVMRRKVLNKYTTAYCPVTIVKGVQGKVQYTSSPISVIKKFEDMATIAYIKLQNEIASATVAGYEYDLAQLASALEILKKEPQNARMLINDLIDIHKKTGTLFKSSKNAFQNSEYGTSARYVDGGLSKAADQYLNILNSAIDLCHIFSGSPKIDTGGQQPARTSNFVTKGMLDGADKALGDLMEAKDYLQLLTGEKKMNMILRLYKSGDKLPNPYKLVFSKIKGAIMEKTEGMSSRELALSIQKKMTEEEFAKLKEELITLSSRYRETNGNEGISPLEMMQFEEWYDENPKYARYMLEMKVNQRQRKRDEQAEQSAQQTIDGQQESARQTAENEAMLLKQKDESVKLEKDLDWRNKKNELILAAKLTANPALALNMSVDNEDIYQEQEQMQQQQEQQQQQQQQQEEQQEPSAEQPVEQPQ